MKIFLIKLIKIYQATLSPDHGWFRGRFPYGYCRYYPTCSQYAVDSLNQHNILVATGKIVKRIIKCNPFSAPAVDQVIKEQ